MQGPRGMLRRTARLLVVTAIVSVFAPTARADANEASPSTAPPTAEDREAARRAFAQGQRAFQTGDFRRAAESFESAYAHAPQADVLWNAARAWYRARELSRAANLYARFLREAPPAARDRNSATSALRDLSAKLARIDVVAPDFQDLRVDAQPLEGTSVYVNPGAHVVEGRIEGHPVRQTSTVGAGDVVSVALVPPAPPPAADAPVPARVAKEIPPPKEAPPPSHGLSPTVVVVGGVVTALAAGFTVWSGLDTVHARDTFDGTQSQLDSGLAKEHRTNIALVITGGVGVLTLATALFLVDWHKGDKKIEVGAGPLGVVARGSF